MTFPAPRRLPRAPGRPPAVLALTVVVLLALLLASATAGARAGPVRIDRLTATPTQAPADGGRITIGVSVSGIGAAGTTITLATTRGAFGTAAGPTRIRIPIAPGANGAGEATAVLVANGSAGRATVTASSLVASRRVTVRFIGEPSSLAFLGLPDGVLPAEESHPLIVQAYDVTGVPVPGAQVTLSTDHGQLRGGGDAAASLSLTADTSGRVRATLEASPGRLQLRARSGSAVAMASLQLVGPPATMQLLALRSTINLHDDPSPAPPRSLIVVVHDAIGQPVPGVPVTYEIDAPGLSVVSDAAGASFQTDVAGAVRAHLSSGEGSAPGRITVTARAAGLESSADVRVAGPPASMLLLLTELGGGDFGLRALLRDAAGEPVVTGYEVQWQALNVPAGGTVVFAPPVSLSSGGAADTVVTVVSDPPASVTVRAVVVGSDPLVAAAAVLPTPLPTSGTPLQAGLNTLTYTGPHGFISTVVAPIERVVESVWRLDQGAGWQGYFPNRGFGQDYLIAHGDAFYVRVSRDVLLPNAELFGATP